MRFKRRNGGWDAYADGGDPITGVTGAGGWVGSLSTCNGATVFRPFCADKVTGKPCGVWHGYTATVQVPGHPEFNTSGHETRESAAAALMEKRAEWAREIERASK